MYLYVSILCITGVHYVQMRHLIHHSTLKIYAYICIYMYIVYFNEQVSKTI